MNKFYSKPFYHILVMMLKPFFIKAMVEVMFCDSFIVL